VADLREPSEVDALIGAVENRFGDLSLVAHLATPRPDPEVEASLTRTPSEQVSGYFDVGVKAAITVTTRLQPILARNAPSHLFFFGSDWALRGAHGPAVFAGAKAAVVHFARSIRREMARSGIRTTVLLPGDIASFDENWEQPIWDLDSPPEEMTARLGNGRILLSDITALVGLALDMRTGRLEEAIVAPDNGDYEY